MAILGHYRWRERVFGFRLRLRNLLALVLIQRILLLVAAYGLIGAPIPSDVPTYFLQAQQALQGFVPLRDYTTEYGLYFPYLMGALLWFFPHPLSIVVGLTVCEWIALVIFAHACHQDSSASSLGRALWLYLWNPCSILYVALGGHNDALVMLLASLVFWALAVHRLGLAAPLAAASPFLSKATALSLVVPVVAGRPRWVRPFALYGLGLTLAWLPAGWLGVSWNEF